jgi:hypothetical protein
MTLEKLVLNGEIEEIKWLIRFYCIGSLSIGWILGIIFAVVTGVKLI